MSRLVLSACFLSLTIVTAGADLPQAPAPRVAESEVVKRLPRGQKFAEQGRIDLFVAATAVWDLKPDDERLWVPALDLGKRLIEKAELKGDRKPTGGPCWFKDYAHYRRAVNPGFVRTDGPYVCPDPQEANPPRLFIREAIQAAGVDSPTGFATNLIVSRGSVLQTGGMIQHADVYANGDVTSRSVACGVIVCDGDVVIDGNIFKGLIVARGTITVKGSANGATLVAGGKATVEAQRKLVDEKNSYNVIKENEPNPLGFITFFELSRVGLEVKAADKVVTVAKVTAGSAAEKAGLKVGDMVLEANGKKPADAESLRRLLRDALAVGDAAVKLQRGTDTVTAKVSLPD